VWVVGSGEWGVGSGGDEENGEDGENEGDFNAIDFGQKLKVWDFF